MLESIAIVVCYAVIATFSFQFYYLFLFIYSYLHHTGGDLREQGEARRGAVPPVGGLQLPFHLHPQPAQAGGAHCPLQGLQGLLQAHSGVHRSLRQRCVCYEYCVLFCSCWCVFLLLRRVVSVVSPFDRTQYSQIDTKTNNLTTNFPL